MTSLSSLPKGVYLEKALPLLGADVPAEAYATGRPGTTDLSLFLPHLLSPDDVPSLAGYFGTETPHPPVDRPTLRSQVQVQV